MKYFLVETSKGIDYFFSIIGSHGDINFNGFPVWNSAPNKDTIKFSREDSIIALNGERKTHMNSKFSLMRIKTK